MKLDWLGDAVAQWIKRWPADLAVPGSSPTLGEGLLFKTGFHCTQPSIITHPSS